MTVATAASLLGRRREGGGGINEEEEEKASARQLMSDSLLDDLITPSHLATADRPQPGTWVRESDENVTQEEQTLKCKTSRFLKGNKQEELRSAEKKTNPVKLLNLSCVSLNFDLFGAVFVGCVCGISSSERCISH